MTLKFRLPHYFTRAVRHEISELYVSTLIADVALAIILLFEPIFLYQVLHFTVTEVLLFFAAVYAWYIVLIPFGAKIAARFGYKRALIASMPFQVLYWVALFAAQAEPQYLYLAPLLFAIEKSLFWPAFHASVSRFARSQQRGREFSIINAIVHITQIAGPFIGGVIAQYFGVEMTLVVASVLYAFMIVPLLLRQEIFLPKAYQYRDTWRLYWTQTKKFFGYLGFAEELLVLTVWPIFIFLAVKNYEDTGILVTVATFIATIVSLYVGKLTDEQNKRLLISIGAVSTSLVWLLRTMAHGFFGIFVTDTASRIAKDTVFIPLSAVTYERAEATHIMPYVVFFEQSLAVGKFLAATLGIILFAFTGSFAVLFAFAALCSLLYALI